MIKEGANVAAVNNDGDLPIDICEDEVMEQMLQEEMGKLGKALNIWYMYKSNKKSSIKIDLRCNNEINLKCVQIGHWYSKEEVGVFGVQCHLKQDISYPLCLSVLLVENAGIDGENH